MTIKMQKVSGLNVKILDIFCFLSSTWQVTTVFWYVAPGSLVETDRRFRLLTASIIRGPCDGASKILWNVGEFLPDYTAQHLRKLVAVKTWNLT
jgi:hypothetical protein